MSDDQWNKWVGLSPNFVWLENHDPAGLIASNFCLDYTTNIWFCIVFGVTFGGETGMTPNVLMDLVGRSKFSLGWGIQCFSMGIGNVIGPPIAGKKSHDNSKWYLNLMLPFLRCHIWCYRNPWWRLLFCWCGNPHLLIVGLFSKCNETIYRKGWWRSDLPQLFQWSWEH